MSEEGWIGIIFVVLFLLFIWFMFALKKEANKMGVMKK